ncbi:MAG TPA: hypothetical protein VEI97_04725, partial [bacterium]|nr:hypothetical protein [bacterium]
MTRSDLFTVMIGLTALVGEPLAVCAQAWQWAVGFQPYTQGNHARIDASTVDPMGNVIVMGELQGTATFGTIQLTGPNMPTNALFVAKLSSAGQWLWAIEADGLYPHVRACGLDTDSAGNVYLACEMGTRAVQLGSLPPLPGSLMQHSVVAKLDPDGHWLSAQRVKLDGYYAALAIHPRTGSVLVMGDARIDTSRTRFPVTPVVPANADPHVLWDGFVASISPTGHWQWVTRFGLGGEGRPLGRVWPRFLDVDPVTGDVIVGGENDYASIQIGPDTLRNAGRSNTIHHRPTDIFTGRFNSVTGQGIKGLRLGGAGTDELLAMTVDARGQVSVAAAFGDSVLVVGGDTLVNPDYHRALPYPMQPYLAQAGPAGFV